MLLMRHDEGDSDYADLVQITQNANRAAALVGQLLAFSRKQTLRPQVLDMRDTLADLTHLLNRLVGEKLALDLQHAPGLRPIRVDKRQLEQVIMNLVVNARDAMPAGSTIRLETEAVHLPSGLERYHAVMPAGDYVAIRECDEGVGIPESLRRGVFEPFFSTKPPGQGTGLGLSTVYGIVKQSGGFIFLDSVEGIGTTFTLYFPVYVGPELADPPMPVQPPPRPKPGAQGLILLVEDELPVRGFAARALRLGGHTVLEAG
jgi:two-component system cell cycle sensor histidine kinase/response regulator CckA